MVVHINYNLPPEGMLIHLRARAVFVKTLANCWFCVRDCVVCIENFEASRNSRFLPAWQRYGIRAYLLARKQADVVATLRVKSSAWSSKTIYRLLGGQTATKLNKKYKICRRKKKLRKKYSYE